MVFTINTFDPAKAVAAMGKGIRPAWLELHADTLFHFLLKGVHADAVDGVFGFGVFTIDPIPIVTLHRHHVFGHFQHMLEAVPYQVHTILTDNGIQFAEQPRNRNTIYSRPMRFDMICEANGIEHRLTKPNHPWTNGQVERMNRTIKDATVKRFHYDSHDQLRTHLADFLAAYNFARRLKTLSGLTPYEYICKIWTSEPDRFILDPIHQMPGLNT